MQDFSEEERKFLLEFARKTIMTRKFSIPNSLPQRLKEKGACFVTINEKSGELRGCIGSLEAREPLIKNVGKNALNAAFHDPRFPSVEPDELKNLTIEISVLTKPERLEYKDEWDLLRKINAPEDGIVLTKEGQSATFLPVVWEHFKPDGKYSKERFLEELSVKAGLMRDDWKDAKIEVYQAILISEDEKISS